MNILKQIYQKIKQYNTIIIHGHTRPDGDCYGAQFGLKNIIENAYPQKKVYVVGETSDFVSFVGTMDVIADSVYQDALCIVVDTGSAARVSDQRYTMGKYIIKIDHHLPIDQYGHLQWVDPSFPSCAQMITYFSTKFKNFKITLPGATAMLTGIITDTGRFKYRGVSKLTFEMAGLLVEKGADLEYIDSHINNDTLAMIRYKGFVYQNFITTDGGFIYLKVTPDVMKQFDLTRENAASIVNLLSGIEGYPVWATFLENPDDGEIRVRLRSSGPDIDLLANKYHGGGHKKACGATLASWQELPAFIEDIHTLIKNYKEQGE